MLQMSVIPSEMEVIDLLTSDSSKGWAVTLAEIAAIAQVLHVSTYIAKIICYNWNNIVASGDRQL